MLTLQRASAGSGKTYTLAKTFIKLFISIKKGNSPRRLRKSVELRDSHSHILAVTFTNKATNEMKQRIVEKLSELGSDLPYNETSYLADFVNELNAGPEEIRKICREALSILLHNYSDFQVSTIDSFFQTILRTFAYETELSDNYQVELDDEYISKVGIDTTLSQVKGTRDENLSIRFWIKQMMDRTLRQGGKWNIFNRNSEAMGFSLYSRLFSFAKKMQSEDFKNIQKEMSDYFASCGDFSETYRSIKCSAESYLEDLYDACRQKSENLIDAFNHTGLEFETDAAPNLVKLVSNIQKSRPTDLIDNKPFDTSKKQVIFSSASNKTKKLNTTYAHWKSYADELNDSYLQWKNASLLHDIYSRHIHYIGLIDAILRNINRFREENDLIQLSDTNQILQKIISDDDTPFVYEKIGYYINHYLIDEFQDTSSLQWNNMYPLLSESIGNGNDDLIIGDAKQSIYRFRKADPDLITSHVPGMFPDCDIIGEDRKHNTNWRSSNEIVQFNNTIFSILPGILDNLDESPRDMKSLYSGAIQEIRKKDRKGYIEINFIPDNKSTDEDSEKSNAEDATFAQLGPLVSSLLKRGYRQSDIAFLVEENKQGQKLIEALLAYNKTLRSDSTPPIEFISEESLRISESKAVKAIVSVLEIIATGIHGNNNNTDGSNHRKRYSVDSVYCEYNFHLASDEGIAPDQAMDRAIHGSERRDNAIHDMLSEMQAVALPALVENITARFVPEQLRKNHAPYIAAFQDKVLEYCETHSSDVASFVKWWNDNAHKFSISSPEGVDAVQIMTIHKSKGLEFRCVIIPYFHNAFTPGMRTETIWVKPAFPDCEELNRSLPPYFPVELKKELLQTPYRNLYLDYLGKYKMDRLNVAYVAFTRAVDELYVFAPLPMRNGKLSKDSSTGYILKNLLANLDPELQQLAGHNSIDLLIQPSEYHFDADQNRFTYGQKPQVCATQETQDSEKINDLTDYFVRTDLELLKYKDENNHLQYSDEEEELLRDPRSDGNIMHEILSGIKTVADLPSAVRKMVVAGKLSLENASAKEKILHKAITSDKVAHWFSPDILIMNERNLLRADGRIRRPDRIIVNPDGHVTVIDYKFGNKAFDTIPGKNQNPLMTKYMRQISEYMRILDQSGLFKGRSDGFLWFINADTIIPVYNK